MFEQQLPRQEDAHRGGEPSNCRYGWRKGLFDERKPWWGNSKSLNALLVCLLMANMFYFIFIRQTSSQSGMNSRGGSSPDETLAQNGAQHCCDLCDYSTNKSRDLSRHMKMHSQNEKFKCPRCSYSSKKQQSIDLHLKKDHKKANPLKSVTQPPTTDGQEPLDVPMENR